MEEPYYDGDSFKVFVYENEVEVQKSEHSLAHYTYVPMDFPWIECGSNPSRIPLDDDTNLVIGLYPDNRDCIIGNKRDEESIIINLPEHVQKDFREDNIESIEIEAESNRDEGFMVEDVSDGQIEIENPLIGEEYRLNIDYSSDVDCTFFRMGKIDCTESKYIDLEEYYNRNIRISLPEEIEAADIKIDNVIDERFTTSDIILSNDKRLNGATSASTLSHLSRFDNKIYILPDNYAPIQKDISQDIEITEDDLTELSSLKINYPDGFGSIIEISEQRNADGRYECGEDYFIRDGDYIRKCVPNTSFTFNLSIGNNDFDFNEVVEEDIKNIDIRDLFKIDLSLYFEGEDRFILRYKDEFYHYNSGDIMNKTLEIGDKIRIYSNGKEKEIEVDESFIYNSNRYINM
jgi:hypothetical protein